MLGEKHIVTSLEVSEGNVQVCFRASWCTLESRLCISYFSQSHVVVYNIETGEKHSKKAVELLERGVALIRHIVALDSAHIVCSIGKDIQIIPCNLKLKIDWRTHHCSLCLPNCALLSFSLGTLWSTVSSPNVLYCNLYASTHLHLYTLLYW